MSNFIYFYVLLFVIETSLCLFQVKLKGPLSVLGRSVVLHAGSMATRVGCGTIAITEWEGEDHPDSTYSPSNPFWN